MRPLSPGLFSVCVAVAVWAARVPAAQSTTTWVSSLVLSTIFFKDRVFHWPGTCPVGYAGWLASGSIFLALGLQTHATMSNGPVGQTVGKLSYCPYLHDLLLLTLKQRLESRKMKRVSPQTLRWALPEALILPWCKSG